jgi:putative hydrolase of the HAD superfamily
MSLQDTRITLDGCDTVLLDMDGTLLDLAFDNYIWLQRVPEEYARLKGISEEDARAYLYSQYANFAGKLDWYCMDHWSDLLGMDLLALHRSLNDRIAWLPGARKFLQTCADSPLRLVMVTNSHPDTLEIKSEMTGIKQFFDHVCSSHELGYPKEQQAFWDALQKREEFDPARTIFVDDSLPVLRSAREYGVQKVVMITEPDSSKPANASNEFAGVAKVGDLLPED